MALDWINPFRKKETKPLMNFMEASAAYEAGDYKTSFAAFTALEACAGHVDENFGRYHLAVLYLRGHGTKRDIHKAVQLLEQAAEFPVDDDSDTRARAFLGLVNEAGYEPEHPRDLVKAEHWYRRAAENGDEISRGMLERFETDPEYYVALHPEEFAPLDTAKPGDIQDDVNERFDADPDGTLEILHWHAHNGHATSAHMLCRLYYSGIFVQEDKARALRWLYVAARNGNREAQHDLAVCYRKGEDIPQDFKRNYQWAKKSADQYSHSGLTELGTLLAYPVDPEREPNPTEAAEYLGNAVALGNHIAMLNLGGLYADGYGVNQDSIRAYAFYLLADDRGNPMAGERLQKMQLTNTQIAEAERFKGEMDDIIIRQD